MDKIGQIAGIIERVPKLSADSMYAVISR